MKPFAKETMKSDHPSPRSIAPMGDITFILRPKNTEVYEIRTRRNLDGARRRHDAVINQGKR